MVDTLNLFRRLSSGAKFNKQRLSAELASFQVSLYLQRSRLLEKYKVCHHSFLFIAHHCQRQPCERDEQLTADALDFFGDSEGKDERRIQSMASLGK